VLDVRQSLADGPARLRGLVRTHPLGDGARACHIEQPVRFSDLDAGRAPPAPELGADTQDIMHALGYGAAEVDRLMKEGLIA
jgi:crotonobetainyl-CoA:carnitine CoA-transferase CaiB-like acyl-CoA transferase